MLHDTVNWLRYQFEIFSSYMYTNTFWVYVVKNVIYLLLVWLIVQFIIKSINLYYGRKYIDGNNTVANAYDEWTNDSLVEEYWGDDIHLGYYTQEEISKFYRCDYRLCKKRFTFELCKYAQLLPKDAIFQPDANIVAKNAVTKKNFVILDLGCGLGGSSRWLAQALKVNTVGISISPEQIKRAQTLTRGKNLEKECTFHVMDASLMSFTSASFDAVWICESTEHMPNKERVFEEVSRILKPKGTVIIAAWCRGPSVISTSKHQQSLDYLQDHWGHAPFITRHAYEDILNKSKKYSLVTSTAITKETLMSWIHQLYLGVINPWPWLSRPRTLLRNMSDAWCMLQMYFAFKSGLMEYGLIRAVKK